MPIYLRKSWRLKPRTALALVGAVALVAFATGNWLLALAAIPLLLLAVVRLNASKTGLSITFKIGPWSWNTRARRQRLDLPGGLHYIGRRN
jgi:hypothetical protein